MMRRSLIGAALIAAIIFGAGYLFGQLRGVATSSAANPAKQSPHFLTGGWHGFRDSLQGGADMAPGPHVDGKVTAVNGDTITIAPDASRSGSNETETVTSVVVSSSTQYDAGPGGTASKSSVTAGSFIIATGTVSADGKSIQATHVAIMPSGRGPGGWHDLAGGAHADGSVTAINGNSYTIKPDANDPGRQSAVTTVIVTGSTQYLTGPRDSSTKADQSSIKVGSYIIGVGTVSADGKTLTATHVVVLPSAPGLDGHFRGQIEFPGQFGPQGGQFGPGGDPFSQRWQQGSQSQGSI